MDHWIEFLFFISLLLVISPLMGNYMAKVFDEMSLKIKPFAWCEEQIYKFCKIPMDTEMNWKVYFKSLLFFNIGGLFFLFILLKLQAYLGFNPEHRISVESTLALNTMASFVTNTDWQAYSGEVSLSYLTQMLGLTVQNFLSAATGNAVLLVLIRAFKRENTDLVGNFWRDCVKTIVYILLPLSIILSIILITQGVIQTLSPYVEAITLEGGSQMIPLGPVASQVAIKQLGTNGGGFFQANSAHPFENPTPITNFLENFSILLIPASSVFMFGFMLQKKRIAALLFAVMFLIWIGGFFLALYSENHSAPILAGNPVLEGIETRIGPFRSVFWATGTTATSNGSTNCMHSSLSPLAGSVAMLNIMLGEVAFGGVGVGMCSMLMFVLLTVFLAGLMIGKMPEYLRKKIEKKEMAFVALAILGPSILILGGSGIACILPEGIKSISSLGPHGLSEILYAFASAVGNNGSAFGGIEANTPFYNLVLGGGMLLGRLFIIFPSLAIAGNLVVKKKISVTAATLKGDEYIFGILLLGIILVVAGLTFFPGLSLGPIVEELLMRNHQVF